MEFPKDYWKEDSPESQGVHSEKLAEAMAFLEKHVGSDGVREAVVVRNGYLIWKGDRIDKKHNIMSCTKSFASTVLGILIDDRKCTLETRAADYVPDLRKDYPDVTLRHFATMTSGYQSEGPYYYGELDPLDGSSNYLVPAKPLFRPGEMFSYWDNAMRKFGQVLTAIAGEPIDEFFRRRVAEPIGMVNWSWEYDGFPRQIPPEMRGIKDAAAGIEITARDLARFGHLFLNRGNWDGKQIVSESWVEQITTPQVPVTIPRNSYSIRQRSIEGRGIYSYNWWLNGIKPDGRRFLPGAPEGTCCATGFNDNRCFIIPEWNMVVVRMGTNKNSPHDSKFWGEFLRLIGEAIYG